MKKLFLTGLVLALAIAATASTRMVVIEEWTNTS